MTHNKTMQRPPYGAPRMRNVSLLQEQDFTASSKESLEDMDVNEVYDEDFS